MLRLYQTVIVYRHILKAILLVASVAAMTLGFPAGASADGDGLDP